MGQGAFLLEAFLIILHPLHIQPRPPLGGGEEYRRHTFVVVVVVIVNETNKGGGRARFQTVRYVPKELSIAIGGIGVALSQYIDAL